MEVTQERLSSSAPAALVSVSFLKGNFATYSICMCMGRWVGGGGERVGYLIIGGDRRMGGKGRVLLVNNQE